MCCVSIPAMDCGVNINRRPSPSPKGLGMPPFTFAGLATLQDFGFTGFGFFWFGEEVVEVYFLACGFA